MKIRTGFVSNSSSSSFIVGVGKVKDPIKFAQWMKENDMYKLYDPIELRLMGTSELLSEQGWSFKVDDNRLIITAPINDEPTVQTPFDPSKGDQYCLVNIGNDEGDDYFWNESTQEFDYDLDEDFFEGKQRKILKMLQKGELLENTEFLFGAGRNG